MKDMLKKHPAFAFGLLIVVNMMWAFQFSGAKIATAQLGNLLVTLVPLAIATLIVAPFGKPIFAICKRESRQSLGDVAILGVVGIVPAQLGLVMGVSRTLASNASVLTLTIPAMMAFSAFVFLGERMTALRWISFAAALAGVCFISGADIRNAHLLDGKYLVGNLLVLASCAGSAFYNSYSARPLIQFSPSQVLAWSFAFADVTLLLIWLALGRPGSERIFNLDARAVWSLVLVAVFSLGASMLLYFSVIQAIDVMRASISLYLLPAFGLLFSVILLHETMTASMMIGSAMILVSSFLVAVQEDAQNKLKETQKNV